MKTEHRDTSGPMTGQQAEGHREGPGPSDPDQDEAQDRSTQGQKTQVGTWGTVPSLRRGNTRKPDFQNKTGSQTFKVFGV